MPLPRITSALSDAGLRLFELLAERAHACGTGHALYHILETYLNVLAELHTFSSAVSRAQREFGNYASAHPHWLERFELLLSAGGDATPLFAEVLWRVYIFQQDSIASALWELYREMQNNVLVETGVQLPRTWDAWIVQAQTFMGMLETALLAENVLYGEIFDSEHIYQMLEESPPQELRPRSVPAQDMVILPGAQVDTAATLNAYLTWCLETAGRVDLQGAPSLIGASLTLDDIFVPLRVVPLSTCATPESYVRYQVSRYDYSAKHSLGIPSGYHELEQHAGLPVSEVLSSSYQVLLLGASGAGKTTLMRHLALEHARILLNDENSIDTIQDQEGQSQMRLARPVPIYVNLAEFIENHQGDEALMDFVLQRAAEDTGMDSVAALLEGLLLEGQCLVLLDGLDQVVNDAQRRVLITYLSAFARMWSQHGNRVVVSSRFAGYEHTPLPPDFRAYTIRPLDRSQIGPFLLKWALALESAHRPLVNKAQIHHRAQSQALTLMREITSDAQLYTLAHNPLWLRILLAIFRAGVRVPVQRIMLCQALADTLIDAWRLPQSTSHESVVLESEITILLGQLANYLHGARATGTVSERELREILEHAWEELNPEASQQDIERAIEDLLTRIRHHRGALVEVASQRYGFSYQVLQEYFAARHLVASYRLAAQRIRMHLHDPRWDDVILLALAFTARSSRADASELVETAILAHGTRAARLGYIPSPYEEVLKRDLFYAARLLGEGVEVEPAVTRSITDGLMDLWLHADRDDPGRFGLIMENARRHLVNLDGTPASRRALQVATESLTDYLDHTRAYAADAFTFWPAHATEAQSILVSQGRELPPLVKRAVAGALGHVGPLTQEAYVLLVGLASDPDPDVHNASRRTLESAPPVPEEVLRVWIGLLRDSEPVNRRLGLRALQRVGTLPPLMVGELLRLFDDPDPEFKQAVIEALSRIANLPDNALAAVCRAIVDSPTDVRVAALGILNRPVALSQEVLDYLLAWRHDDLIPVREAVARALGTCLNGSDDIKESLLTLAQDPVAEVRVAAVEQLIRKAQQNPRVMHTLLHHTIEDQSYAVRRQLATALGQVRTIDEPLRNAIRILLSDGTLSVQEATIDAIAELGHPGEDIVEDLLISMTISPKSSIAFRAVRTLATLERLPDTALRALVKALPLHWETLGESIKSCLQAHAPLNAEIGHEIMDIAVLKNATASSSRDDLTGLRALAIELLGLAVDTVPGVLELLIGIANDALEIDARIAAARALAYMRTPSRQVCDTLLGALRKGPVEVCSAAAVALGHLAHTQPNWPLTDQEIVQLADTLSALLMALPRRAAWEPDNDAQNEVLVALSKIAARLRPAAPRLPS